MPEAEEAAVPGPEADRVSQAFAGVGAALGLGGWYVFFAAPLMIPALALGSSRPRLAVFLMMLSMLTVLLAITGSSSNPFSVLYLVNVALAAVLAGAAPAREARCGSAAPPARSCARCGSGARGRAGSSTP